MGIVWRLSRLTWTIATCKRVPRRPTAMEVAAITAGPVKNLTAIENVATDFPQAMIFGCKAMNKPETQKTKIGGKFQFSNFIFYNI